MMHAPKDDVALVKALLHQIEEHEAQRADIARFLHDRPTQLLTVAGLHAGILAMTPGMPADGVETARTMQSLLDEGMDALREAMRTIDSGTAEKTSLPMALRMLVDEERARVGGEKFSGVLDVTIGESLPVSRELRRPLLIMVREALRNALTHGDASFVTLASNNVEGVVEVKVSDNGKGFDPREGKQSIHSLGLHRLEVFSNLYTLPLEIESEPAKGTVVRIRSSR
jgi:signal transduction histidine kinase